MTDVTNEQALAEVNGKASFVRRGWVRLTGVVLVLILAMVVGMLLNGLIGGWWTQRKLDRANMDAMVLIVQYNLQQGKLLVPPQLVAQQQPAAPPATAPVPAPAPAKPVEAPPKK